MELLAFLDEHLLPYQRVTHPAVFTCAAAEAVLPDLPGEGGKNLFLRDRKGRKFYLLATLARKQVDLRRLGEDYGLGKLSFASESQLRDLLGIEVGAVSLLALFNDHSNQVECLIDVDLWHEPVIHAHPLVNTATLLIEPAGMEQFFALTGHTPRWVEVVERD